MTDAGKLRLGLEVGMVHLGVHVLSLRWRGVIFLVVVIVGAAIEIGGDLVLVWLAVLLEKKRSISGTSRARN